MIHFYHPISVTVRSLSTVDDPSATEFINHPDYQQISSFFLGWVFLSSLHHLFTSSFSRYVASRAWLRILRWSSRLPDVADGLESQRADFVEKQARQWANDAVNEALFADSEYPTLMLLLTIMFAMASLTQFTSLLPFSPSFDGGQTACAFAVAWGGMSAEFARIFGLLGLGLQLRELGIKLWESLLYLFLLSICAGLVFVTNVLGSGVLSVVPSPYNIALCFRRHFFPTSLTLSLTLITLELYCLGRFAYFLCPGFLRRQHKVDALKDLRFAKPLSLLVLDILTIVPSAIPTNVLGDYVPFSIGAVIVLAIFNISTYHNTGNDIVVMSTVSSRTPSSASFPTFAVHPPRDGGISPSPPMSPLTPSSGGRMRYPTVSHDPYASMPLSAQTTIYSGKDTLVEVAHRTRPMPPRLLTIQPARSLPALTIPVSPTLTVRSYSVPVLHMPRPVLPDLGQSARQFEEQVAWSRNGSIHPSRASRRASSVLLSPATAERINEAFSGYAQSRRNSRMLGIKDTSRKTGETTKRSSYRSSWYSFRDLEPPSPSVRRGLYRDSGASVFVDRDLAPVSEKSVEASLSLSAPPVGRHVNPDECQGPTDGAQLPSQESSISSAPILPSTDDLLRDDLGYLAPWITTPLSSRTSRIKGPRPRPVTRSMVRRKSRRMGYEASQ